MKNTAPPIVLTKVLILNLIKSHYHLSICRKYRKRVELHHEPIPDSGKVYMSNNPDSSTDNIKSRDVRGSV